MRFNDRFDEMDRLMEQMRERMMRSPFWGMEGGDFAANFRNMGGNLTLETDEEGYVVLGDMPGFEKEEIDIRFDKGVLTVTGTHEVESEYASQRRQVHEQLTIPGEIREADITASYRNGVLEIHLPTVEDMDDDSHRIEISD
ncbi:MULTISPECIES: Hsp20/alpha crystallin family protein [unclassified Haladaptatus]|uniref:Hsp20/alpha crystallin family protein n=1 Tax=unclassified Haladaptatus TaxID=2622732 RepID=UPI0023E8C430|nr:MULTISPECIES: Hsp20/alpha crystallin family protein [unclassified Haladaptatus]